MVDSSVHARRQCRPVTSTAGEPKLVANDKGRRPGSTLVAERHSRCEATGLTQPILPGGMMMVIERAGGSI